MLTTATKKGAPKILRKDSESLRKVKERLRKA